MYEWRCLSCELKYSTLAKSDVKVGTCPECGADSKRLISAPNFDPKMGLDPDFKKASAEWERKNKQKVAQDKKFYKEHGADKKHHSYGS